MARLHASGIRRVVTGHDANGKAIVLADGFATSVKTVPLWPGLVSTDLWKTDAAPVLIRKDEADPTSGPRSLHPAPRGTILRISIVPPPTMHGAIDPASRCACSTF